MLTIHRISRDDVLSWALMPFVLARLARFSERYDTETTADEVTDLVRNMFSGRDIRLGMWVVLDDQQAIIGHLFATPEPLYLDHWRYCLIRQAEADLGINSIEAAQQVFEAVQQWCRSLGLSKILALTHRDVDAMMRKWGFQKYKALLSRDVDKEV